MHHEQEPTTDVYPLGRGYGNDYMRGGEVYGGYGYSEREEYQRTRGELRERGSPAKGSGNDT
jgi:hypothetical protein